MYGRMVKNMSKRIMVICNGFVVDVNSITFLAKVDDPHLNFSSIGIHQYQSGEMDHYLELMTLDGETKIKFDTKEDRDKAYLRLLGKMPFYDEEMVKRLVEEQENGL